MSQRMQGTALSRQTVEFLREQIRSGAWPVNSRIPTEKELQETLGVGKTTVREAVSVLASLGMLEALPSRGTFVRSRTPVSAVITDFMGDFDIADLLGVRRALEVEAAELAAASVAAQSAADSPAEHSGADHLAALREAIERDAKAGTDAPSTPERGETPGTFHHLVFEAAGNELLMRLYAGVMSALRRLRAERTVVHGSDHASRLADHREILAEIERGDAVAAGQAMAAHVDRDLVATNDVANSDTDAVGVTPPPPFSPW